MKIDADDFRVREDDKVDLDKWPTTVDPVYKSKAHYKELLAQHVDELSEQQQLLYASDSFAVLLIFQAMDAAGQGRRDPARHVRDQSAGLPGVQFQAPECERVAA